MYWVLYVTFWGTIHQIWQFIIEFESSIQQRSNNTRLDFMIHTACDLTMFCAIMLAFFRFPKLWDYMGLIWITMYCVYHYSTAITEGLNFP